jgi:hypothetical protein
MEHFVYDESRETDFSDGYADLVMKFDCQTMVKVIGEVQDGDVLTLKLTGTSYAGEEIEAEDIITILKKGSSNSSTTAKKGGKKK